MAHKLYTLLDKIINRIKFKVTHSTAHLNTVFSNLNNKTVCITHQHKHYVDTAFAFMI